MERQDCSRLRHSFRDTSATRSGFTIAPSFRYTVSRLNRGNWCGNVSVDPPEKERDIRLSIPSSKLLV
jgi:hypothetical protein